MYIMAVETQKWVRGGQLGGCARAGEKLLGVLDISLRVVQPHPPSACVRAPLRGDASQERRNVEGTLYVVKRRSHPRFQLVVLNKLSTGKGQLCVHGEVQAEAASGADQSCCGEGGWRAHRRTR